MKKSLAVAALFSLLSAGLLAAASPSGAHGGFPTRLGVSQDPDLVLLARFALVYLVDGEGMNVHLTVFDEETDPGKEYASGKIDLFVDAAVREDAGAGLQAVYPGAWVGEFLFSIDGASPRTPVLVAHSRVTEDLRFTLLRETLEKLLAAITAADLERLRVEGGSSPRDTASAARRLLKEKGLL